MHAALCKASNEKRRHPGGGGAAVRSALSGEEVGRSVLSGAVRRYLRGGFGEEVEAAA